MCRLMLTTVGVGFLLIAALGVYGDFQMSCPGSISKLTKWMYGLAWTQCALGAACLTGRLDTTLRLTLRRLMVSVQPYHLYRTRASIR
jgi:hypothetical protein